MIAGADGRLLDQIELKELYSRLYCLHLASLLFTKRSQRQVKIGEVKISADSSKIVVEYVPAF